MTKKMPTRRKSRHPHGRSTRTKAPRSKVSPNADKVPDNTVRRGSGGIHLENTAKELEAMQALIEPHIQTYLDAGKRLGISENAVKQRMGRVQFRYRKAKAYANSYERWQEKRRKQRDAGYKLEGLTV